MSEEVMRVVNAWNVKFMDALRVVLENGGRMSRASWLPTETGPRQNYIERHNGHLMLRKADGVWRDWIISDEDIDAADWMTRVLVSDADDPED